MKHRIQTNEQLRRVITLLGQQLDDHRDRGLLVSIEPLRAPKTHMQNAKLHAMISDLANHLGYASEELREWFKQEYGPKVTLNLAEPVTVPKSWRDLSKSEASDLIEHVQREAAECGYYFESEEQS